MLQLSNSNIKSNYVLDQLIKTQQDVMTVTNANDTLTDNVSMSLIPLDSNVKSYGAVGDGVEDDTVAIQDCIDANTSHIFFPAGTYRITAELNILNKPNFTLFSDSAIILQDFNNSLDYSLAIIGSAGFRNIGNLVFKTDRTDLITTFNPPADLTSAIYLEMSPYTILDGVRIIGPFKNGIYVNSTNPPAGTNGYRHKPTVFTNLDVQFCLVGVDLTGEYCKVSNSSFNGCRIGVYIKGGNNSVVGSMLNANRIGIYVLGGGPNSDHGKIVGCTLNHNMACGIFMKEVTLTFQVANCEIWATQGDHGGIGMDPGSLSVTLGEIYATTPSSGRSFGMYLLNCRSVHISSCTLASNNTNVGLAGYKNCIISNNMFYSGTNTQQHLLEHNGHASIIRNEQNVITNNVFDMDSKPDTKRIQFALDAVTSEKDTTQTLCTNNRGGNFALVCPTGGTAENLVFSPEHDFLYLHYNSAKTVTIHHAYGGSPMVIFIAGLSGVETKDIFFASPGTYLGTNTNVDLTNGRVVYNSGTKKYTFGTNGKYKFTPIGTNLTSYLITFENNPSA